MKTSLVVKRWGGGYVRARTTSDSPERLRDAPRYLAAHTAHGLRGDGRKEWHEPESVGVKAQYFHPKRGKVNEIRFMDAEFIDALERIDAERDQIEARLKQLREDEQAVLDDAYLRGLPLTVEKAKEFTRINGERREQQPAAGAER
jgi:hypothetical protein